MGVICYEEMAVLSGHLSDCCIFPHRELAGELQCPVCTNLDIKATFLFAAVIRKYSVRWATLSTEV